MLRWTDLAAPAVVALALVAAVEAEAAAAHAASRHITVENLHVFHPGDPGHALAPERHSIFIKTPARSTQRCISMSR